MMRPALELALREACAELSTPQLRLEWVASRSAIEALRVVGLGGADDLIAARCEIERTDGGLVARQGRLDANGRPLERGYSLQFSSESLWRRWTDGAELDDEELGAELVGWTFRLAVERPTAPARR
jgi:hypothetical protein